MATLNAFTGVNTIYASSESVYYKSLLKIVKYNEDSYKLLKFNQRVRKKGFEENTEYKEKLKTFYEHYFKEDITELLDCPPIDKYLINSIFPNDTARVYSNLDSKERAMRRAKNTIKNLIFCNNFDYAVTLTLDKTKISRSNYSEIKKEIRKRFKAYQRKNKNFQFVLVREFHDDGVNIHFHGCLKGLNKKDLFDPGIKHKGKKIYYWQFWNDNFGFNSLKRVTKKPKDLEKVANYFTKYITKDMFNEFNNNRYMCSRGLKRPETVFDCDISDLKSVERIIGQYDFSNEFINIKKIDNKAFYKILQGLNDLRDSNKYAFYD